MGYTIWGREHKDDCARECRVVMGHTILYWQRLFTSRRFVAWEISRKYWGIREKLPHRTHMWLGGWRQTLNCYACYE